MTKSLVHYRLSGEHGAMQAGMVLEKQLRAISSSAGRERQRHTRPGMGTPPNFFSPFKSFNPW